MSQVRMQRIYVVDLRSQQDTLLQKLQALGVIHLSEAQLAGFSPNPERFADEEHRINAILKELQELLEKLTPYAPASEHSVFLEPERCQISEVLQREIAHLIGRVQALLNERTELQRKIAAGEELTACGWRPIDPTLREQLAGVESALKELAQAQWFRLLDLALACENRLVQLKAASRCAYTDYTFALAGWVPQNEVACLKAFLHEKFPGALLLESRINWPRHEIPVTFDNPGWAKAYELFLGPLQAPVYGSADPTVWLGIFFPIFLALMIGDLGYGLLLVLLAVWARAGLPGFKKPSALRRVVGSLPGRSVTTIFFHVGILSVLFGTAFGKFFGLIMPWLHFDRMEHLEAYFVFIVTLGAAHLTLGFILGAISAACWDEHRLLVEKIGMIALLVGLVLVAKSFYDILPEALHTPGIILAALGFLALLWAKGAFALLETFKLVADVLSYGRIFALGLVSMVLAKVANDVGGLIEDVIVGVLLALLLHIINFILIGLKSLHSARLQYVEFFSKFYQLGGRRYEPFRLVTDWSLKRPHDDVEVAAPAG
jgi:V/A-type H+-transporting ATPase subunit I